MAHRDRQTRPRSRPGRRHGEHRGKNLHGLQQGRHEGRRAHRRAHRRAYPPQLAKKNKRKIDQNKNKKTIKKKSLTASLREEAGQGEELLAVNVKLLRRLEGRGLHVVRQLDGEVLQAA